MFFDQDFVPIGKPCFYRKVIYDVNRLSRRKKKRVVFPPNREMRDIQDRMRMFLKSLKFPMPSATACIPGIDVCMHLSRHRNYRRAEGDLKVSVPVSFNRFLYSVDIKDAFPSVSPQKLVEVLSEASGYPPLFVGATIEKHFIAPDGRGLPTGASASQDLFNMYCEVLVDRPMRAYCEERGLRYSRYLDDILVSFAEPLGKKRRSAICRIVRQAGFEVNEKKIEYHDLRKGPARINGIMVAENGRMFLSQKFRSKLRFLIRRATVSSPGRKIIQKISGMMGLLLHVADTAHSRDEEKIILAYRKMRRKHLAEKSHKKAMRRLRQWVLGKDRRGSKKQRKPPPVIVRKKKLAKIE